MATERTMATSAHETHGKNNVSVRVLDPSEYHLLAYLPPFNTEGIPNFGHTTVVVMEDNEVGRIVGYWMLFDAVHVEPLWIHEDYRKRPGVGRRLWRKVRDILVGANVPGAFAMILDHDAVPNVSMAKRLGFTKIEGELYYIRVKEGDGHEH